MTGPNPSVVTRLDGGLGNQLFQYAAGFALARRHGAPFKVDTGHFSALSGRSPALRDFGLTLDEASAEELQRLRPQWGPSWKNQIILWTHRLTPFRHRRWVREETLDFDARLLNVRPPCYLDGCWQSEKYFADCSADIRRLFRPLRTPGGAVASLARQLAEEHAVAVHVRRGDYVHNQHAALFHGVCSLEYYARATRWIREKLPQHPVYVFSDDPVWVREHLRLDGPVHPIDTASARTAYEDFYLLCHCVHFVIANSSFSWWPAWLNAAPGQWVVAPRRWFLGHDVNPIDRFPAGWHLIDA